MLALSMLTLLPLGFYTLHPLCNQHVSVWWVVGIYNQAAAARRAARCCCSMCLWQVSRLLLSSNCLCSGRVGSGLQPPPPSPARGPPPLLTGIRPGSVAQLLARLESHVAAPNEPTSPCKYQQKPRFGDPACSPGAAERERRLEPGVAKAGGRGLRGRWYGDAETQRIMRILRSEPAERGQ